MSEELDKMFDGMTLGEFEEASNHPYECKCDICRKWWENVGPEE